MKKLIAYGLLVFILGILGSSAYALTDGEQSRLQIRDQDENCPEEYVREQKSTKEMSCEGTMVLERDRDQSRESENAEADQARTQSRVCGTEVEEQVCNQYQLRNSPDLQQQTKTASQVKAGSQDCSDPGFAGKGDKGLKND